MWSLCDSWATCYFTGINFLETVLRVWLMCALCHSTACLLITFNQLQDFCIAVLPWLYIRTLLLFQRPGRAEVVRSLAVGSRLKPLNLRWQDNQCSLKSGHFGVTDRTRVNDQLTYCTSAVNVDSSPRKRDQRWTAAFDRALLTNEYQRVRKRLRIGMFYSKLKFSNFV